jgi:DNA-binding IclR family transcriptional regulator
MRQVNRALDILDALGSGPASLAKVTAAVGAPRASVHRLLVALEARGYVQHVSVDAVYQLGPAVHRLAARNTESRLVQAAAPALADLRAKTGETTNLAVLDGGRIVYAAILDGTRQPRMSATLGSEADPHATALGKAILSKLDRAARERILPQPPYPRYTPHTITTAGALAAELKTTARRGYAVEIEESTLSATCVAVPIVDSKDRAVAAISISGVSGRLPASSHKRVAAEIRAWTKRIEQELDPQA